MLFSFAEQLKYELTSIFRGYPNFVLRPGGTLEQDEIPVFTFHTIDPQIFENQLKYLKDNGYTTLSMDQCTDALAGRGPVPHKPVLLTIDDGRSSFWRFAYPLLKKYNMRATLFVIPGFTSGQVAMNDNLLTLGDSPESRKLLDKADPKDETLCSWWQLKEMWESGLISIESHTMFHREVFVEPELVGWIGPQTSFVPHYSPITAYLDFDDCGKSIVPEQFLGLPLFRSSPLMSAKPALILPADLQVRCRDHFQTICANGLPENWQEQMSSWFFSQNFMQRISPQSFDQMAEVIRKDLILARQLIQQNVNAKAGGHLCLPFTFGAPLVIAIAKEVGLKSCLWGTVPGRKCNRKGTDSMYVVRVKNDFIFRLPGQQRQSLLGIYINKIKRRLRGEAAF